MKSKKLKYPKCVRAIDLKEPSYRSKDRIRWGGPLAESLESRGVENLHYIELWLVQDWGWVIPTLIIRNVGRRSPVGVQRRTYGIRLDTETLVRVGFGPHVEAVVKV